jgi:peptide/nickel transport system permease protein
VNEAIRRTFPTTAEIAVLATLFAIIISIPFGALAAVNQDRPLDHITRLLTVGALAVPDFWIATIFIVWSSEYFDYTLPLVFSKLTDDPALNIQTAGIAAAIIGLRFSGVLTRLMRSSMLEVLRQDYMRTARSKGMRERSVVAVHGLRNAALPVLTLMGLQFAALLGGTVVIETVFSIPGSGQLVVGAIRNRDFTLIQGLVLLFGTCLVLINLAVDLLYGFIDPRIRVSG